MLLDQVPYYGFEGDLDLNVFGVKNRHQSLRLTVDALVFMVMALGLFFVSDARAGPVLINGESTSIDPGVSYLEDPTHEVTIEQAIERRGDFLPGQEDGLNLGLSSSQFWFRVPVRNTQAAQEFVVALSYPVLDFVDYFVVKSGAVIYRHESGDLRNFESRHRANRLINFPLLLDSNEEAVL